MHRPVHSSQVMDTRHVSNGGETFLDQRTVMAKLLLLHNVIKDVHTNSLHSSSTHGIFVVSFI